MTQKNNEIKETNKELLYFKLLNIYNKLSLQIKTLFL